MARTGRVIFDNAVYHILNRGHDRGKLFRNPIDFKMFKETLTKYKEKFPAEV
jgi:REP element-mobilizing transposase RayT